MIISNFPGGGSALIDVIRAETLPPAVINGQLVILTDVPAPAAILGYALPDSPLEGDLWIHTVDNGAYPVTATDGVRTVITTPGAVLQYVSGAWVYREAYVGVGGLWLMCSTHSPLATLSWEAIGALANSGEDMSLFFEIGDRKQVVPTEQVLGSALFDVEIIGFAHDDLVAGGKAPITFCMVDCFSTQQGMNPTNTNVGGWGGCELRTTLRNTVYSALPADLRAIIKEVNKSASAGNKSSVINITADTLFLLAEIELTGSVSVSAAGEGAKYSRFTDSASRIKRVNGVATRWWGRSPDIDATNAFFYVQASGGVNDLTSSTSCGVACGFCV